MPRYFLLLLLFSTLFLPAASFALNLVHAQSEDNYTLQIQGIAWNRSNLNVLLTTPNNVSWWDPSFLNSTLRAIGQWNDAISDFVYNYSSYAYLSNLKMQPTVSNQSETGFDIYINWTETSLESNSNEIGLETATIESNAILFCNISLAAHTSHGNSLNDIDMQNIALHELGHSLGLGHSNYTSDIMYPVYTLLSPPKLISTLDVYGVAVVFAWMQNFVSFYPVEQWLQTSQVSSPTDISYNDFPVSSQNASPQTLANNPAIETLTLMAEILLHPEILSIVILFIVALFIIAIIPSKRKRKQASTAVS